MSKRVRYLREQLQLGQYLFGSAPPASVLARYAACAVIRWRQKPIAIKRAAHYSSGATGVRLELEAQRLSHALQLSTSEDLSTPHCKLEVAPRHPGHVLKEAQSQ